MSSQDTEQVARTFLHAVRDVQEAKARFKALAATCEVHTAAVIDAVSFELDSQGSDAAVAVEADGEIVLVTRKDGKSTSVRVVPLLRLT